MSKPGTPGMEETLKHLEVLMEERAILRTLYSYAHFIDYGPDEGWVGLFTEDGVFEVRSRKTGNVRRYDGRDALSGFIAGHLKAPARYWKHLLIEPIINISGKDQATVESYYMRLDECEEKPSIASFGRYKDKLVKRDGRWLFKERIAEGEAARE